MKDQTIARRGDWETVATMVAQRLLVTNMDAEGWGEGLDDDGKFGQKTDDAVRAFQRRHPPLVADGVVGPKTFAALGLRTLKAHPVRLRPQRRPALCWAAAASMMLGGVEPAAGPAAKEKRGSLVATDENVQVFAKHLGWDNLPFHTSDAGLLAALQRAPIWMGGDSVNARNTADAIHAVVIGGMYAYDWVDETMVLLKIFDPWPSGAGRIYFMEFQKPRLPGGNTFSVRWFLSPPSWKP